MKIPGFLLAMVCATVLGCSPKEEPRPTTSEISEQHEWTGTNEAGRSTNAGISPGGANTRGTTNP